MSYAFSSTPLKLFLPIQFVIDRGFERLGEHPLPSIILPHPPYYVANHASVALHQPTSLATDHDRSLCHGAAVSRVAR
jgi:hypothetical protein